MKTAAIIVSVIVFIIIVLVEVKNAPEIDDEDMEM